MKPSLRLSPSAWCKYAHAESITGAPVAPWSPLAVRWDLRGAFIAQTQHTLASCENRFRATPVFAVWQFDNSRSGAPCATTLEDFNDTTTFEWVEQGLREASL